MRYALSLIIFFCVFTVGLIAGDDQPQESFLKVGDRIAIIGDSITEQKQYSVMIETYLRACTPELKVSVIQFGWSGERAGGFAARMNNDLMGWKPTVATLCYGMNDGGYQPYKEAIGAEYRKQMERIAECFRGAKMRVVVGSPSVVDSFTWRKDKPDADKAYNENLARLGGIGKEIAVANGYVFADVHAVMMESMTKAKASLGEEYAVAGGDGVHPGQNGHLCMAYAFLKGLGMDGHIGEIRMSWPDKVEVSDGHALKSVKDGSIEVESLRYPFCFSGGPTNANGTESILPYLPFNLDLNRFLLVVKDLPEAQADVIWGKGTKTFTKEQLEKGINLAEEFLDNPFSEAFRKVVGAVAAKQSDEAWLIKGMLNSFRNVDSFVAKVDEEGQKAIGLIRKRIVERLDASQEAVQATVQPVNHVIKIIPKA